ncbi:MAG: hypothetical protein ACI8TX_000101 [Hyphomicrobiaceae bacterium]|jgi:hypothetical protein
MTSPSPMSRSAQISASAGNAAVVFSLFGVVLAYTAVVSPMVGFILLALGLLNAVVGVLAGIVGLAGTRASMGVGGRSQALRGFGLSVLVILAAIVPASAANGLPRINDITTDFENPPVFIAATELKPNVGRDMAYPGESFARQQLPGYPDLGALVVPLAKNEAMDAVVAAIGALERSKIIADDRATGRIEATQTSLVFHFVDDVVVRVEETENGSRINIRSKSRDGKGDLGANAKRIRAIFSAVLASVG